MNRDFGALTRRILHLANRGLPRIEFLRELSGMVIDASGCDAIELRLKHRDLHYRWLAQLQPKESYNFAIIPGVRLDDDRTIPCLTEDTFLEHICKQTLLDHLEAS